MFLIIRLAGRLYCLNKFIILAIFKTTVARTGFSLVGLARKTLCCFNILIISAIFIV